MLPVAPSPALPPNICTARATPRSRGVDESEREASDQQDDGAELGERDRAVYAVRNPAGARAQSLPGKKSGGGAPGGGAAGGNAGALVTPATTPVWFGPTRATGALPTRSAG